VRDAQGHAVEPARQRIGPAQRAGLSGQDQERGLKCVIGVVRAAEHLPAHALHERPMPFHERRESQLIDSVLAGQELLNELPVRKVSDDTEFEEGIESLLIASIPETPRNHVGLLNSSRVIVHDKRAALPIFLEIP
jgi:hypothetical protein